VAAEAAPLLLFAEQLGRHALPAFLAALLVAMLSSGLAGVLLRRRHLRRTEAGGASGPTLARLFAGFASGFAIVLGAASLFAAIAGRLGPGRTLGLADQALADAVARHTPEAALRAFGLLTHFGDPLLLLVLGALVSLWLWRRAERLLAVGWAMALLGNAVLNPLLKQVFERTRPLHDDGLALASGFSFPSGHSSGAMVTYGMLLYVALRVLPLRWHPPAAMAAVALVMTTACSRVFLRVHFASDVAAGLLSGLAWLAVCVASLEFARQRRARRAQR
jgi:membrane-associated phospholipid phosphatase